MMILLSVLTTLALAVSGEESRDSVAQYQFSYRVKDDHTGQDFGQEEERQGYNTGGEYQVSLPDGRRQIVTYSVADPNSGYVADVTYTGEARYEDTPGETLRQPYPVEVIPPALPPIRTKPSLPRVEKAQRPLTQPPSAEEVRFISRPTKIVPTVIKVQPVGKNIAAAPQFKARPIKIIPTISKKPPSPKVSPRPTILPKLITRPGKATGSKRVVTTPAKATKTESNRKPKTIPRTSPNNTVNVKKPISAMKSVPSTTTTTAPPPVYISTETPKLSYKDKYHTAESQVLYSLFREDINGKDMKPPPKKP